MIDFPLNEATLIATLLLAPIISSLPVAFAWLMEPKREWTRNLPIIAVFGLFISLICSLYILFNFGKLEGAVKIPFDWLPGYNISFVFIFDYLSKIMGVLTAFIAFLIGVYG
ncbi:MAG: NADH-quinone oxidoreductase subunit L, partial [Archaeoglobaceae archaeon]